MRLGKIHACISALFVLAVAGCTKPVYVTLPITIGEKEVSTPAKLVVENDTGSTITLLKRELCEPQNFFLEEDPIVIPADGAGFVVLLAERQSLQPTDVGEDEEADAESHFQYFVVENDYVAWPPGDRGSGFAVLLFANEGGLPFEVRINLAKAGLFDLWHQEERPIKPAYKIVISDLTAQGGETAPPQPIDRVVDVLSCGEAKTIGLVLDECV